MSRASVTVDGRTISSIGRGVCALVGVGRDDGSQDAAWIAEKIVSLRIFPDEAGQMNVSLKDAAGEALVVSQFTLYGDARRGRRPSFVDAASGDIAEPLVAAVCERLRALGVPVAEGRFAAHMHVDLVNDGPVTILLESPRR